MKGQQNMGRPWYHWLIGGVALIALLALGGIVLASRNTAPSLDGGNPTATATPDRLLQAIEELSKKVDNLGKTQSQAPQTPQAVVSPTATAVLPSAGSMLTFVTNISHDSWKIQGTDRLDKNTIVKGWLQRLKDPAPARWKTFPNIPNPDVKEFRVNGAQVPDGVEYGTYSSPYCYAHPCDIPVGAWEYRYISGDYQFLGTECKGDLSKGCMLVLVNVMDQSYTWRGQDVDNGFTVRGRYWNGDALEWGIWGLVSHGAANMLNMPTLARPGEVLNAGDPGNSGANCGSPKGCKSVDVTVVVHAGDAIIAVAKTTVAK